MPGPNKSKDPVQLRLREHKRNWNASYRNISQRLKAFKNGLNGKGDAKNSLPPSDIKEPFPAEVGGYLNQLASDFQKLVGDASSIIKEQENYSRTRKKKQPKGPKTVQAPAPPEEDKIVQQLSNIASADNFDLYAEGTSKLSRFWQYFTAIFSQKESTKARVGMLRIAADLHYDLLDFQNEVLSLGVDSIPKSISRYYSVQSAFRSLHESFENFKLFVEKKTGVEAPAAPKAEVKPAEVKPTEEKPAEEEKSVKPAKKPQKPQATFQQPKPETPAPATDDISTIKNNVHRLGNVGATKPFHGLVSMIDDYDKEGDPSIKVLLGDRIKEEYEKAVKSIEKELTKRLGSVMIESVDDLIEAIKMAKERGTKKASIASSELIKVSHNFITRYLKKQLAKIMPFNKTAAIRLNCSKMVDACDVEVKKLIDILEGELDVESVKKLDQIFVNVAKGVDNVGRPLGVLTTMYKEEYYKASRTDKGHMGKDMLKDDPLLDFVMKRKIRRDLSGDVE